MESNNKRLITGTIVLVIIIIIILFLKSCFTQDSFDDELPSEIKKESILEIMKKDEDYLHSLYEAPNICEKEWVEEYRKIGVEFEQYINEYQGNDAEIISLLNNYIEYGKQIQTIAISIDKSNYEEGINQLEKLKEIAKENEKELQRLYEKETNENK